jgi:CMP-N-acetylneuraminic acid synthetase
MVEISPIKILVVVAARAGSKGVKNKNIRDLLGKPLVAYTIEQVIKWGKFHKFIVSTDSPEIARIAQSYGAEVPFLRPPELATDTASKLDTLRHALGEAEKYYNTKFDAVLDLDVTSPIRTINDIDNIVSLFKEKKADCVFSVVKAHRNPYFNMVEKKSDGTVIICKQPPKVIERRQDAPLVYEMNASMYVYDREFLLGALSNTLFTDKTYAYEMSQVSGVDIDREIDFKYIEFLVKEGLVRL